MKNKTDEINLEITETVSEYQAYNIIEETKNIVFEKDSSSQRRSRPNFKKKTNRMATNDFENYPKQSISNEAENTYYYPKNEKLRDTKLLYVLSAGSLIFLGILLNSIFG
jgi:hypothetical protein